MSLAHADPTPGIYDHGLPFPDQQPPGYEWLEDEPVFDPHLHLALEMPATTSTLLDLGYSGDEVSSKATDFAVSSPFRILSDEGSRVMLSVARRLEPFHRRAGERIERTVRGGCYRSRWLRDLCVSPDLTKHMAAIYRTHVAPHPMPVHLGHLNFAPTVVGETVDKWHHDTLPLDVVIMVTDPATIDGGQFEWFQGTKAEAAELAAAGEKLPADRATAPDVPGAGYGIALHGDMVVHRAAALNSPGERITMVNGYVSTDRTRDEQSRSRDLIGVDDPNLLWAEWAKFAAWRSAGRLQALIEELEFSDDVEQVSARLESALADANQAVSEMRAGISNQHHYEK